MLIKVIPFSSVHAIWMMDANAFRGLCCWILFLQRQEFRTKSIWTVWSSRPLKDWGSFLGRAMFASNNLDIQYYFSYILHSENEVRISTKVIKISPFTRKDKKENYDTVSTSGLTRRGVDSLVSSLSSRRGCVAITFLSFRTSEARYGIQYYQ